MHAALVGPASTLGWTALKALLLTLAAVIGLRLAERRTIAQLSAFDLVASVSVGAIIGRVPNSSTTSFLAGLVTLVVILLVHRSLSYLRRIGVLRRVLDHQAHWLIRDGQVDQRRLRRCGLTETDLAAMLREQGQFDPAGIRQALFEARGTLTVLGEDVDPEQALDPQRLVPGSRR